MMADIWRKILGRKPSEPSNEGGQSKEEGNTRGKRGKKTEEGKKEIGGGANEKGGRNTKKDEEERPSLESGRQKEEEKSKEIEKKTSTGEREGGGRKEIKDAKKEEKEWRFPESGYRIFKFMLFLAGFLTGFFFTYMLCSGYLTEHLSGKFLEHKDQIFLDASVGVGIVAGLLTLCIFYLGLFILGKGGQTPGNYGGQNITGAGNLKDLLSNLKGLLDSMTVFSFSGSNQ